MKRLALTVLVGCAETPPTRWPDRGCTAARPSPTTSVASKRKNRTLMMDDGVGLHLEVLFPEGACHAGVVLVPPGFEAGTDLVGQVFAQDLASEGVVVVTWDPRGRGRSEGTEDVNGFRGQDDLAAILRWTAALDVVDPDRVVVVSRSFGGALAAGALGRHEDLAASGWVDYESPGWLRDDLAYVSEHNREVFDRLTADVTDLDAWWAEREPAGLISSVSTPYDRVQGIPDHALGSYLGHARAMLNEATRSAEVRYNGVLMTLPVSDETVRSGAYGGQIEADGPEMVAATWLALGE